MLEEGGLFLSNILFFFYISKPIHQNRERLLSLFCIKKSVLIYVQYPTTKNCANDLIIVIKDNIFENVTCLPHIG